jgi:hypothetical protein
VDQLTTFSGPCRQIRAAPDDNAAELCRCRRKSASAVHKPRDRMAEQHRIFHALYSRIWHRELNVLVAPEVVVEHDRLWHKRVSVAASRFSDNFEYILEYHTCFRSNAHHHQLKSAGAVVLLCHLYRIERVQRWGQLHAPKPPAPDDQANGVPLSQSPNREQ